MIGGIICMATQNNNILDYSLDQQITKYTAHILLVTQQETHKIIHNSSSCKYHTIQIYTEHKPVKITTELHLGMYKHCSL